VGKQISVNHTTRCLSVLFYWSRSGPPRAINPSPQISSHANTPANIHTYAYWGKTIAKRESYGETIQARFAPTEREINTKGKRLLKVRFHTLQLGVQKITRQSCNIHYRITHTRDCNDENLTMHPLTIKPPV